MGGGRGKGRGRRKEREKGRGKKLRKTGRRAAPDIKECAAFMVRDGQGAGKGKDRLANRASESIFSTFFKKIFLFIYLFSSLFIYLQSFRCQFRLNSADSRPKPAHGHPAPLFPSSRRRAISSPGLDLQGSHPLDEPLVPFPQPPSASHALSLSLAIPRVLHQITAHTSNGVTRSVL